MCDIMKSEKQTKGLISVKKILLTKLTCLLLSFLLCLGLTACGDQPDFEVSSDGTSTSSVDFSKLEPATVKEVDGVDWESCQKVNAHISYVGEDEVWGDSSRNLFRGTVSSVKTYTVDYGSQDNDQIMQGNRLFYSAVLSIRIDEVYRGDIVPGEEITIFLSLVDDLGYYETTKADYESMIPGTEGIFEACGAEESYMQYFNRVFYPSSIADYCASLYMVDGVDAVTFRFLGDVLTFSTLDEGEDYIRQKLAQYAD